MKNLILIWALLTTISSFSQCVLISTANGSAIDCNGDCNGIIYYTYQNTASANPGAPYVVTLTNQTTGQWMGSYTYTTEGQTFQYPNLCAGSYLITIQGNGCSTSTTTVITQPLPIQASVNTIDPAPGQNNGSATVVANGGVQPYTYSINGINYQSSATFSSLAAGTYTAYVKDANDCVQTVDFTLSNPASCNMAVTANGSNVLCYGACNAVIQYAYTLAGVGPCVIELQNSVGQVLQMQTNANTAGSGSFSNVCAGVYTVEVTDANGCTAYYSYTVGQPAQLYITNVATTAAAYGTSNGSATITATGGTAPYTYSLNGTTYQSSNVFTNLSSGVHVAFVKDANGCIQIYTFVVQETTACTLIMTSNSVPVSCYGSASGSIYYVYNNAVGPVSIVLQNTNGATMQSQTSQTANGQGSFPTVPAGTYYIVATDASGCSYTNTIYVTSPTSGLTVTGTSTPATSGMSNGTITMTASGGTAPYSYSLNNTSNWQSSNVFTGLAPGVYIVYVQDANGCMTVYTIQLTQTVGCNQAIVGTPDHVDCAGENSGSITYTFTSPGTSAPYIVELISNGNTVQTATYTAGAATGTFSNLFSGVYTLELTAANGCVSTVQVYVDQPAPVQVTNVTVTNATTGMSNGSAVVTVVGGTAPYTYTVNNGTSGTSNVLSGLSAGIQILLVTDANGCSTIYCFIVNESPACPSIAVTMAETQSITCNGQCNGSLSWTYTSGGTAGLYEVILMDGNNVVSENTYTSPAFQGVFNNLCAGDYSITVTDPNGCSATYNYILQEPDPLYVTGTSTAANAGSSNGTITMAATGGSGQYEYSLNNTSNWQSSNVFTGLATGVYMVFVRDENGCMQVYTVQVGSVSGCNLTVTATQAPGASCGGSCNESIIYSYTTSTGGAPFTVILTDQNGNTETQTQTSTTMTGTFTGLCQGLYTVTVQGSNGCVGIYTVQVYVPDYMSIIVNSTDPTPGLSDGSFTLNVSGGTSPYEFSIDDQVNWTSNPSFNNLPAGVYLAYTKDANTCTQVTAVKLGQSTADVIELKKDLNIYPNPTNGLVFIEGSSVVELTISNSNGQAVDGKIINLTNGWMTDLTGLAPGIYMLSLDLGDENRIVKIVKE
jgi:hypothetical protein